MYFISFHGIIRLFFMICSFFFLVPGRNPSDFYFLFRFLLLLFQFSFLAAWIRGFMLTCQHNSAEIRGLRFSQRNYADNVLRLYQCNYAVSF